MGIRNLHPAIAAGAARNDPKPMAAAITAVRRIEHKFFALEAKGVVIASVKKQSYFYMTKACL